MEKPFMAGFGDEIGRWRLALRAEKLEKGQRVAVLMPNGIEHVAMDQAALSLVPAPMHALDNPELLFRIERRRSYQGMGTLPLREGTGYS
jgi:acyl-CoA synthetase (AMP-forming)/AMP-acid ligase II